MPEIKSDKRKLNTAVVAIVMLLLLSLLNGRSLISSQINNHMDSTQYLTTLVEFDANIRAGNYLPEWAPDLGNGHGHPLFTFLPPGLYWIAETFHLMGFLKTTSINLTLLCGIFFSALGMFWWTKRWLTSSTAFAASVAYIYGPYFLTDLYVRGAYGEFMAFAAFGWLLWGIDGLIFGANQAKHALVVATAFAMIFLFHNPVALIFAPVAFGYPLVFACKQQASWRAFLKVVLFLAMGAGLACFFWIPALLMKEQVQTGRLLNGYLAYYNHFIYLHQLFYSAWGYNILVPGAEDGMSQKLGELQWLGLFMCLVFLIKKKPVIFTTNSQVISNSILRTWYMFLFFASLYAIFFCTAYSKFIWDSSVTLQYIQFSMRFLTVATFTSAPLVMLILEPFSTFVCEKFKVKQTKVRGCGALAMTALVLVFNLALARPPEKYIFGDVDHSPDNIARYGYGANNKNEFEPAQVWIVPAYANGMPQMVQGEGTIQEYNHGRFSDTASVLIESESASVRLHRFYFPGWKVYVDGTATTSFAQNPYGALEVKLSRGAHIIEAVFQATPARKICTLISAGFVVVLLLLLFVLGGQTWPHTSSST